MYPKFQPQILVFNFPFTNMNSLGLPDFHSPRPRFFCNHQAKLDLKTVECNTAQSNFEHSFCDQAKQAPAEAFAPSFLQFFRRTQKLMLWKTCQGNRAWHNYQECYRIASAGMFRMVDSLHDPSSKVPLCIGLFLVVALDCPFDFETDDGSYIIIIITSFAASIMISRENIQSPACFSIARLWECLGHFISYYCTLLFL